MRIIDIGPDDPRLVTDLLPVLTQLRPHLTTESVRRIYAEGHPQGLRFTAAYDSEGRCVGVAGWRILALTFCGRKLYIDDLVSDERARSAGIGKALLEALVDRARAAGCAILDLDSAVHRTGAHRFYMRERMHISAFHFQRSL